MAVGRPRLGPVSFFVRIRASHARRWRGCTESMAALSPRVERPLGPTIDVRLHGPVEGIGVSGALILVDFSLATESAEEHAAHLVAN